MDVRSRLAAFGGEQLRPSLPVPRRSYPASQLSFAARGKSGRAREDCDSPSHGYHAPRREELAGVGPSACNPTLFTAAANGAQQGALAWAVHASLSRAAIAKLSAGLRTAGCGIGVGRRGESRESGVARRAWDVSLAAQRSWRARHPHATACNPVHPARPTPCPMPADRVTGQPLGLLPVGREGCGRWRDRRERGSSLLPASWAKWGWGLPVSPRGLG